MMHIGMKTHVTRTSLEGLVLVNIDYFKDERGFFIESWSRKSFTEAGIPDDFVQEAITMRSGGLMNDLIGVRRARRGARAGGGRR